jgi:hypothetical protein
MHQTILKVKSLEKFIHSHGEDAFISQTISKLVAYKIQTYINEIKKLDKELKRFERHYKMESSVFLIKFQEGKIGDSMDFIEWASLYQMRNALISKKTDLDHIEK